MSYDMENFETKMRKTLIPKKMRKKKQAFQLCDWIPDNFKIVQSDKEFGDYK